MGEREPIERVVGMTIGAVATIGAVVLLLVMWVGSSSEPIGTLQWPDEPVAVATTSTPAATRLTSAPSTVAPPTSTTSTSTPPTSTSLVPTAPESLSVWFSALFESSGSVGPMSPLQENLSRPTTTSQP